jgi:hypothetical protein
VMRDISASGEAKNGCCTRTSAPRHDKSAAVGADDAAGVSLGCLENALAAREPGIPDPVKSTHRRQCRVHQFDTGGE